MLQHSTPETMECRTKSKCLEESHLLGRAWQRGHVFCCPECVHDCPVAVLGPGDAPPELSGPPEQPVALPVLATP